MICVFPDPYPDELLYSLCARYSDMMAYPNSATVTSDFFGEGTISAVVDLPNRLNHLVRELPPGHLYSVEELIYRNTQYPFYAPFLPHNRALIVRDTMGEGGQNRVKELIGLTADRLGMPTHLRFCPPCAAQDKEVYGEIYWHRIHQLPGVDVCPHHAVFLEDSKALWRNQSNPREAFSATRSVYDTSAKPVDTFDHAQHIQLKIARQAWWLLEHTGGTFGGMNLRFRYHDLLLRKGLAYYGGQIRTTQLVRKFLDYYPRELLVRLGCAIENSSSNWLLRLLHASKAEVAHHPIRHILLLIFIGSSPAEVFNSFTEYSPFGKGPWPCLNHASGHYSELRVIECRIKQGEKKNAGKPAGTFCCPCGFSYTRIGPDQTEEDRFNWSSIQAYGMQWERKLKELWEDPSLTLKEVAQKLGVNELTVKRRAISMRLTFPRQAAWSSHASRTIPDRYRIKSKPHQEIRDTKREDLLSLLHNNPQASRTDFQALAPSLIDWLRQHDRAWLDTTLPPIKKKQPPKTSVEWGKIDLMLSESVNNAASQIRSDAQPRRVSITAIIRIVGHRTWLEKKLDKLPLTSQALATHLESFEDYSIHRIVWASNFFREKGVAPSQAMFSRRAGVRGRLASNGERARAELDSALATLASTAETHLT